jgi:fluoride exporter
LQKYILIAMGGSLGALARYFVDSALTDRLGARFPYGTLIVNVSACLLLGFSLTFLGRRTELSLAWRFFFPIGFIGAYSTFSTLEWETFSTLQAGALLSASLYVVSSLVLGLLAIWCGVFLAKAVS